MGQQSALWGQSNTIGIAVMGCGRIAQRHASLLADGKVGGARLAGVCDPQGTRAADFGSQYGVPHYATLADLLEAHGSAIDAVSVLTESGNHADHAVEVARSGRHVIVEKPMALTLADADRMIEACDKAGVKLFVVKQNRFNTPVQLARRALEAGHFGRILSGSVRVRWRRDQQYYDQDAWRGTWAMDGGVFANQASHHVDLLQWFMGTPVSVFARSRAALANIEADDTGAAIIEFESGAMGVVEATTAARPKNLEGSLSILGEKGTVVIGGFAVNRMDTWEFEDEAAMRMLSEAEEKDDNPSDVYGFGHRAYLDNVVSTLRNEGSSLVDGLEGRRSLELVSAIYESIASGQEVALRYRQKHSRLGRER